MKVKSYGLFEADKELILIFSNPSQKDFLDYELKNSLKKLKKSTKIEFQNSANGVWYCRQDPQNTGLTQILLLSKESSSISIASNFLNKASELSKSMVLPKEKQKLKYKIDDLIKLFNANNKVEALNSSVTELEDIIKGNVNKLVNNMTELDTAERKSSMMAELSMQFEKDSRALEQKMKRRKCLMKAIIVGVISVILGFVIWVLFL